MVLDSVADWTFPYGKLKNDIGGKWKEKWKIKQVS